MSAVTALDPGRQAAVRALARAVADETGSPPLSDAALGLLDAADAQHWLAFGEAAPTGYAQLHDGSLEIVARDRDTAGALLDGVGRAAGGERRVWTHGTRSVLVPELERRGYRRVRVLHQMRRPLRDLPPVRPLPDGVRLQAFRPGTDEDDWLQVNAAAFAGHPEQGRWTRRELAERLREPWFRVEDVLLARAGADLLGYHWTKVHPDGTGEVYVLGVAPKAQGTGLGGALLDAGLHHLADRGCPAVLLYVDEDNRTAVRLYERSGFAVADTDVQWAG